MRKEQDFILYPYTGGDLINLQSNKRFIQANLRTGEALINGDNRNYANSMSIVLNPVRCQLPDDIKTAIQSYLWHNKGKDGDINGFLSYENKELFIN